MVHVSNNVHFVDEVELLRPRNGSIDEMNSTSLPVTTKETSNRPRSRSWTSENPTKALAWVSFWYFFSTSATFMNKILIKQYIFPAQLLTICHMFIGSAFDAVLLWTPNQSKYKIWRFHPTSMKGILCVFPLSLMGTTSKIFTYWSYATVPVSITHTAKASAPIFNVLVAFAIYSKKYSSLVYFSLLPIVLGVSLASISEVQVNKLALSGVLYAISSTFIGVIQSMYAKFLLRRGFVADSINLHFVNGLICVALNSSTYLYSLMDSNMNLPQEIPYTLILVCSIFQFLGSFTATLMLGKVTELTYSIMTTMKRVVIIGGAVIYFGTPVTLQSFFGMVIALIGVGFYQWAKIQTSFHRE